MRLKVSSAKRRPFCLGLNVLKVVIADTEGYIEVTARFNAEPEIDG